MKALKDAVKKRLPPDRLETVRRWREQLRNTTRDGLLRAASTNGLLTDLYFALVNRGLSREVRAVAAGRLRYRADHRTAQSSYFLLRRNTHRLEKGLIMRPRRPVFAADYIGPTVEILHRAVAASPGVWEDELVWAYDVLEAYFAAVDGSHKAVAKARARFDALDRTGRPTPDGVPAAPYRRALDEPPSVDFDSFVALSRRRRSVRWYLDLRVDRELIDRAVAAAGQAPSACNRQPFQFRIFDDPAEAAQVTGIPMGTVGFSQQVPAVAVLVGRLRAYPSERDRHAIYIDGSMAAMSLIFALETMGLASCSINWPDHEPYESRMGKRLGLEADERVIMLIAFGWPDPDGEVPFSSKRPLNQLRRYG